MVDGRRDKERERERAVSEMVCISAAGQLDGSPHREPYILIRDPAAASNGHQQNHTQSHTKCWGGVTCAARLLAVEVHDSVQKQE